MTFVGEANLLQGSWLPAMHAHGVGLSSGREPYREAKGGTMIYFYLAVRVVLDVLLVLL